MRIYHGPRTVFGRMFISTALIVLILPVGALTGSRGTVEQVRNGGRGDLSDISYYPLDLDLPELSPHHVIICPDMFMDEAKPLARWRTRLGLPSRIYSIDEIDSLFEGRDREERVHNFLRQLHQNHTTFKWLLILGDAEYLSPRPLWHYAYERIHDPKETDYSNFYRSDAYYAGLDSDWDENGNGRYGEINGTGEGDLDWDVYVGRVPASNETQASNYISKLIRYEGNPVIGSWTGRFLNWGSVMEPPNNLNTGSPHMYLDYNSNAYKVCEKIRESLPPDIENRSLYDYPRLPGGSYQVGGASDTLDRSHMLSEFNNGASMLNFVGQARYNANALNDYGAPHPLVKNGDEYYWNEPLRYTDHSIFTNGDMMPFMYASTCDTAKFFEYDDSSLETWLTSSYGGVIGIISATGISYRGEEANRSWGNWHLVERFWRIFLNEGFTRPGQALKIQKDGYRSEWYRKEFVYKEAVLGMIYTYILLGDPWVDVHTGQVKRFMGPEWLNPDLFAGEHTYRFQVLDSSDPPSPVSEPTVAIYSPSVYEVARGNSTGWVEVSLDLVEGEEVNLTYTGHNMIPRTHRRTVLEEISDVAILRGDVILDPPQPMVGEETTLSVGVRNLGGMAAEDVVLRLKILGGEEGDPDVFYDPVLLGDIDPRGESSHEFTWKVRAGHHLVVFSAYSPSEDLDPLNNELVLPIFREGPMFEFSPGTGILLPSEKVRPATDMQVYYTVFNSGNGSGELDLKLFLGNPEEGGYGLGEVLHAGAVHPGGWSNGTLSFRSPNSSGVIYMAMDPEGRIPPGMVGDDERVLLEIDHQPSVIRSLSMTMPEDTADQAVGVDRAVEDGETITLELGYRVASAPNLTCWIERKETGILLHVTPDPDWYGNTTALVGVSDMLGEVFVPVRVEVEPVNDPPRFRDHSGGRLSFTLVEDREFTTVIEAYDIEGDIITYSSIGSPFTMDPAKGILKWTPTQEFVGVRNHTITASDGPGSETSLMIATEVLQVNDPPSVDPVDDVTVRVSESIEVNLTYTDEEGDSIEVSSISPLIEAYGERLIVSGIEGYEGTNRVQIMVRETAVDDPNSLVLSFNVTVIDDRERTDGDGGIDSQYLLAAVGVALVVFSLLLLLFSLMKGRREDRDVREEKEVADAMYDEEMRTIDERSSEDLPADPKMEHGEDERPGEWPPDGE